MTDIPLKIFGDRVLVEHTKPVEGTIHIPQMAQDRAIYRVGRVVRVGDGRWPGKDPVEMLVAPGELVYFQTNDLIVHSQGVHWNGQHLLMLLQNDLIARVRSLDVSVEVFEPLRKWILVKPEFKDASAIVIPESVRDPSMFTWTVTKVGARVDLPLKSGDQVTVRMDRCSLIVLGRTEYAYIEEQFVTGLYE